MRIADMCLQEYINTATQLCILLCALFQLKYPTTNSYALISYGLSKFLGGHQSRALEKALLCVMYQQKNSVAGLHNIQRRFIHWPTRPVVLQLMKTDIMLREELVVGIMQTALCW